MKVKFFLLIFICLSFVNCNNNTFATGSNQVVATSSVKKDNEHIKTEIMVDSINHPYFSSDTVVMNDEFPLLIFRKSHKPAYYVIGNTIENDNRYDLRLFIEDDKHKWQQKDSLVVSPNDEPRWQVQDLNKDGIDDIWLLTDSYSTVEKVYEVIKVNLNPTPKLIPILPFIINFQYIKKDNLIVGETYNNRKELFLRSYYQIKDDNLTLIKKEKVETSDE